MKNLLARTGIDRSVFYGILSKVALAGFSLLTILLIAWRLPAAVQGFYYTYANLMALQTFAELGLGIVVVQYASHCWASLRLDEAGRIEGDPDARARLVGLGRFAARWYAAAGAAAALGIGSVGMVFFTHSPSAGVAWQAPWIAFCACSGLKMALIPVWSLLEGCNQVASLYRCRFVNVVAAGLLTAAALVAGLGLWAPSIGIAGELISGMILLGRDHREFLRSFLRSGPEQRVPWRREILPLQIRIAVSWMSGYFITSLITPVLFHYRGPQAAGQWGMTWSMFAMVTGIALLWIQTKGPQFGVWIARREFETLDREFLRSLRRSVVVTVLGAAAMWGGVWALHRFQWNLSSRVLEPLPTGLLALAVVLTQVPFSQSIYLRAHKREPLVLVSVVQAVLIGGLSIWAAQVYGAVGTAAVYLGVAGLLGMPWSMVVWLRCRAAWHAPVENC